MNETTVFKLFPHTLPNGVLAFIGRCLVLKASPGKSGVSLFDDEPVWVQRCQKIFVKSGQWKEGWVPAKHCKLQSGEQICIGVDSCQRL